MGFVFLVSAVLKAVSYELFYESLLPFEFITSTYTQFVAIGIIIIELFIGFTIISGTMIRLTLIITLLLLFAFMTISIYSVLFDKNWICACFGSVLYGSFSISSILRDGFIIILTLYVFFFQEKDYCYRNFPNTVTISLVFSFGLLSLILLMPIIDSSNKNSIKLNDNLTDIKIQSVDNQLIETSRRNKFFLLYIIFNPEQDCISCLSEYPLWNKIYKDFNDVIQVIGIARARDIHFIKTWKDVRKLKFQIILDPNAELFDNYNISTPMKILVDSSNRTILLHKSSDNPDQQKKFYLDIQKFVGLDNNIPIH